MPHSSGGGHSSSSYHSSSSSSSRSYSSSSYSSSSSSSSHSSSSGSSGSYYRRQKEYFPGSRRYRYYGWGHKPKYIYSNESLETREKPGCIIVGLYVFVMLIFVGMFVSAISPSPRLKTDDYGYKCEIYDYAGIIDDDEMLLEAMTEFSSKTGVPTVVATVHNAEWEDYYYDIEEFAYYYYVANYEDEDHWIIILSMDNYTTAIDFIGMQGDNTDNIITSSRRRTFNKALESKLTEMRTDRAIAYAFDQASEGLGEYRVKGNYLAFTLALINIMWFYRGYKWFINPRKYELM